MREFYDRALEQVESGKHTFAGDFHAEMPGDVGGAGRYMFLDSPLGSSSLDSERFRGEDDLQQLMQKRKEAIDHLVDLLLGVRPMQTFKSSALAKPFWMVNRWHALFIGIAV